MPVYATTKHQVVTDSFLLHLIFVMSWIGIMGKQIPECLLPAFYKDDVLHHEAEEGSQCNALYLALNASVWVVDVWTDGATTAD